MGVDYREVLIDLENRKAEYLDRIVKIDAAIAGIKALEQPEQALLGSMPLPFPRPVARKALFGRDPSQLTWADKAAAVLPPNGDPMHLSEIRRKVSEGGREVSEDVLRDSLTRKDKTDRFKKHGRGMFGLNVDSASVN